MIRPLQICSRHLAGTVFVVIGNPVFEIDHDRVRRRAAGTHAGGGREDQRPRPRGRRGDAHHQCRVRPHESIVYPKFLGLADVGAVFLVDAGGDTGGHDGAGALTSTEIFDPTNGTFTAGPNMSVARAGHSATLFADGRILFAGGDGNGSAEILAADLSSSTAVGSLGVHKREQAQLIAEAFTI